MSDHNRGAYTPQSEAPLAFDARSSRGPGERPMPITLLASAGVLVLLIIVFAVFLFRGSSEPDVAAPAPIDTMKAPPPVAEAKPAERTGLQVYADGEPLPDTPSFAPAPETPTARPVVVAPKPAPTAPSQPVVAQPAAPVQQPALRPAQPAVKPVEVTPVVKPATTTPPPPTSTAQVQIGAFSSAALAEDGWSEVAQLLPGQMAGKTKRVQQVPQGNGSTLFRTSVAGFASRQEATAFCEALKARSRACLVRN